LCSDRMVCCFVILHLSGLASSASAGYGPGAKQSQEESIFHSVGGIKLKAAKFSEERGATCKHRQSIPRIDIHYKSEDKGGDNAKAY